MPDTRVDARGMDADQHFVIPGLRSFYVAKFVHGAADAARTRPVLPDALLVGEPASPGRASGAVRILRGPADFRGFRDGEVLVARLTAPAWTPLFGRAAAVVTDGGTLAATPRS